MNEQSNISAVRLDEAEGRTFLKRAARLRVVADELKSSDARTLCLQLAESYEKSAAASGGQPSDGPLEVITATTEQSSAKGR